MGANEKVAEFTVDLAFTAVLEFERCCQISTNIKSTYL